ncbi:MAG: hypothetical protein ACOX13_01025 [Bacillota bacterium]
MYQGVITGGFGIYGKPGLKRYIALSTSVCRIWANRDISEGRSLM